MMLLEGELRSSVFLLSNDIAFLSS